jgi:hypothetical protein
MQNVIDVAVERKLSCASVRAAPIVLCIERFAITRTVSRR